MSKPVILTGLRANNDLHLGNYLGALLPMVDMANKHAGEYQINLFVPDLHSFTTPIDHTKLYQQVIDNVRVYLAAGLAVDHDDVFIYRQSFIPAHSELTVILNNFTQVGEMTRMTQFKQKLEIKDVTVVAGEQPSSAKIKMVQQTQDKQLKATAGLFDYPVLMAADILLYGAAYVPVGEDQTQHLEFTRDIAESMNKQFGDLFTIPKPVKEQHAFFGKGQGLRVRDMQDPTKKMSKSDETGNGVIFLSDTPEVATKKIMSATTDSVGKIAYDYEKQPGISNLLDILKLLGGQPDDFIGQNQYGPLKEAVATKVSAFLADFQQKLATVDETAVLQKLESSEKAMNEQANKTLYKVQQAVGLRAKA